MLRTIASALCCVLLTASQCEAQDLDGVVYSGVVENGDTIMQAILPSVVVEARWTARDRRIAERYTRLMRNVIKVYPYARVTGELMREYEHDLRIISERTDQGLYLKLAEAELRAEYEAEVKDLTIGQGRILLKLIDRETGQTSYDLVKQLRGSFNAFVWQGLAKLFGQDLKSTYDMAGEDRFVEHIVQRIERGELVVPDRGPRTAKAQARLERRKARLYKRHGLVLPETSMN
ncbi:MAG: DUF4294 domain-containing protein [Flavobacteriales bacterium]